MPKTSKDVVITSACRTGIGKYNGMWDKIQAYELGKLVIKNILEHSSINPDQIDEVIFGQVLTSNNGQNPVFFYEDDPLTGMINIYYSILADSEDLSGTGVVAFIVMNISAPGQTTVELTSTTKIVDKDNQEIQLNGLGKALINAQ